MNHHDQGALIDFTATTGDHRAVVIGAGMGGLLAARVLADHVHQVIVLDRDTLSDAPSHRKNIPQGRHVHALLSRGRTILESLFPAIADELTGLGAISGDMRRDLTWFQQGGYLHDPIHNLPPLIVSRPLLESHLRHRVAALPNVVILPDCQVTGLLGSGNRERITGVRVISGTSPDHEHELRAALTIDASGRGSRLPAWLENLGYPAPKTLTAGAEARYATRAFRRTPGSDPARLVTVIVASAQGRRGGVMIAQEGDRWLVSLASRNGAQPPTELNGFIDFARTLEAPDIYRVVRQAEPLDNGAIYRFPKGQRRFYERLDHFPGGILPFADAICSFNPVYGQGMTIAAIEAEHLQRCLRHGVPGLAPRFFNGIASPLNSVWNITNSGDLRYLDEPVTLSRPARFISWYMDKLLAAAQHDGAVASAYYRATNLIAMPPSLLRPNIAMRVAFGRLRHRASPGPQPLPTELASSPAD